MSATGAVILQADAGTTQIVISSPGDSFLPSRFTSTTEPLGFSLVPQELSSITGGVQWVPVEFSDSE